MKATAPSYCARSRPSSARFRPSTGGVFSALLAALLSISQAAWGAERQWTVKTQMGPLVVDTVAGGLDIPWSLAFLPDGRMLVTERRGQMRIVTREGAVSAPLAGVPEVYASSQAGLFDVVLAP